MMQRDETVFLEPWLRYYGYLFGYENLVVFDNGSVEPSVLDTLARYARAGVTVLRDFADNAAFQHKGAIIGGAIRHLDETIGAQGYDFALPVDCDEFIVALTQDGMSCARQAIHASLDAMIGRQHAFSIELSFYNLPGRTGWFFPDGNRKGFLAAGTIAELDHGFHLPRSRIDDRSIETPFAYLHFHNRPFADMQRHAARKLEGLVDVTDHEALRRFRGAGHHLVGYFFMDETGYRTRYDDAVAVAMPEFTDLMAALGVPAEAIDGPADYPVQLGGRLGLRLPLRDGVERRIGAFDGLAYIERSGDVREAGMPPLYHYLLFGRGEKRPPTLVDHAPEAPLPPDPALPEGARPPAPLEPQYSLLGRAGAPPPGAVIVDPATLAPGAAHERDASLDGQAPEAMPETDPASAAKPAEEASGWAFRRFDAMIDADAESETGGVR